MFAINVNANISAAAQKNGWFHIVKKWGCMRGFILKNRVGMVDMNIEESAKILKAHNAWLRCRMGANMQNPKDIGVAIEAMLRLAEPLKIADEDPLVGSRYMQNVEGFLLEVRVIWVGSWNVIYRRKGYGTQLCGRNDFLKNFKLIGSVSG